jgi:hypothetical protein
VVNFLKLFHYFVHLEYAKATSLTSTNTDNTNNNYTAQSNSNIKTNNNNNDREILRGGGLPPYLINSYGRLNVQALFVP